MSEELWRRGAGELAELIASARGVLARGRRRAPGAHRGRQRPPERDRASCWPTRRARRPTRPTRARAPRPAARRPVHGQGEHRRRRHGRRRPASRRWPRPSPPSTRRRSSACAPPGAIPIGRTNLPDLGLRIHTDSSLRGLTRNPWDPDVTAGGSSGGEAAALASGMSPLGLGNDVGGSLRNPAHCCGIASIKPTPGRVPHATVIPPEDMGPAMQLMAVEGVMARRVADVRLGLAIVAGMHPRDPESVPVLLDVPRTDVAPRGAAGRAARRRHAPRDRRRGPARRRRAGRRRLRRRRGRAAGLRAGARRLGPLPVHRHPRAGGDPARGHGPGRDPLPRPHRRALPGAGRGGAGRHAGRAPRDRPRLGAVRARAPADPQPDLDAAAVPARLGRRERGATRTRRCG